MAATTFKNARIEIKTTLDAKELLAAAARASGVDLTSFVINAAVEKARASLQEHSAIRLSQQGQAALARILQEEPAEPTQAMKDLMALPRLPVSRG